MYKIILSYDGTNYFGWQKTQTYPSIQQELQSAIFQLTQEKILPEAASRTDRGVHAKGQVVSFDLKKPLPTDVLKKALNGILPKDIRIHELEEFPHFHPTLQAKEKEYHYHICLGVQMPMDRLYSWNFKYPLDFAKMERAARDFLGTHDFSAFANEKKENPICTLSEIKLIPDHKSLILAIKGNRFLYKMARNIAGTLVYVGCGKLDENCIPKILESKKRSLAGITAPAHGLVLYKVFY